MFFYIWISRKGRLDFFKRFLQARKNISQINTTYKQVVSSGIDKELLVNPVFLDGINYEQDKVEPIYQYFKHKPSKECEYIIDQVIELTKSLWVHGMVEGIYNFTINCGVTSNKKVVLIDFNEITFTKSDVLVHIQNKKWLKQWSYTQLSKPLQFYYAQKMDNQITIENLEFLWLKS
jgi:hypothetical protein